MIPEEGSDNGEFLGQRRSSPRAVEQHTLLLLDMALPHVEVRWAVLLQRRGTCVQRYTFRLASDDSAGPASGRRFITRVSCGLQ